jgi:hypothetical protein
MVLFSNEDEHQHNYYKQDNYLIFNITPQNIDSEKYQTTSLHM